MRKRDIRLTLVSDELPKGCGLATYHDNLFYHLKRKGIKVESISTNKILRNYPISISSKIKTKIAHFTDQKSAAALFFSYSRRYKTVITVHDVAEIINFNDVCRLNSLPKKMVYKVWRWIMKTSLKKADMIIADSEYTKKEIIRIMGPEDGIKNRIKVIYIAADDYLKSYEIKKGPNSILYVGSNLANKNLKTLMRAFSLLVKKIPKSKLILVGKQLVGDEFLKRQIKELDLEKNIVFKGYIENIAKEYSRASLTVMPSLYEGFGLPVLEAMMCGCPVICTNKTSLPEVGGDAAMYFDGYDEKDLAEKMYRVLIDEKLQQKMIKKGFEQSKKFSWNKTTKEILQIYQNL